jgi:hypothetical protein
MRVHVQPLSVLASTSQPRGDGRLSKAEDPRGRRRVQPFGQRGEHHGDLLRGRFQSVQGRVAPGSEGGTASLAAEGLDLLSLTMLAIPNQRVHASVSVAKVAALPVRTGKPFGRYALGSSPPAFHLTPGAYRIWRWPSTQRGSGSQTTGRAVVWGTGLQQTVHRGAHSSCFEVGRLAREPVQTPEQHQS